MSARTRLDNTLNTHPRLAAQKSTLTFDARLVEGLPAHSQKWIGWYSIVNHQNVEIIKWGEEKTRKGDALESAAAEMLAYVESV